MEVRLRKRDATIRRRNRQRDEPEEEVLLARTDSDAGTVPRVQRFERMVVREEVVPVGRKAPSRTRASSE